MSRIYFHSPDEDAEVRGSERAYFRWLCYSITESVLELDQDETDHPHWIREWLPTDHYALQREPKWFAHDLMCALEAGFDGTQLSKDGLSTDFFSLALNTAMVAGSEPVRLAARLHGQCEIHCWVRGKNRAWMADVIEAGLTTGVYRESSGWLPVIKMLRKNKSQPVVTSYSVCEQFPNAGVAGMDYERFDKMTADKRWKAAFDGLLSRKTDRLEIVPGEEFHYLNGLNAFKLKDDAFTDDLKRRGIA